MKKGEKVMKRTVKQRLNEYISYLGISVYAFQLKCGLSNGCLSKNLENSINKKTQDRIAAACPDLNMDWVLTGEGRMLLDNPRVVQNNVNGDNFQGCSVNLTPTSAQVGTEPDEDIIEPEEVTRAPVLPSSMLKVGNTDLLDYVQNAKTIGHSNILFEGMRIDMMVPIHDDALAPRYERGDKIALQAYDGEACVIPGRLYGINTKSNGMQIRILLTDKNLPEGDYLAHSLNSAAYPDYVIHARDIITIFKTIVVVKPCI